MSKTRIDECKAPRPFTHKIVEGKEKRPGVLCVVEGPMQRADALNGNRRIYPRSVWERCLQAGDVQERLRTRRMVGELDHPASGATAYERVSHVVTEVTLRPDGEIWGQIEVLDTPHGKIAETLLRAGVTMGISSRGDGSTHAGDDGATIVEDDYVPETWDFVVNPSTHGAFMGLAESQKRSQSIAEAFQSLVTSTSDPRVLVESHKIINELKGEGGEAYDKLAEAVASKLVQVTASVNKPSDEQENPMITEKEIADRAAVLANSMVETQVKAIKGQYEAEATRSNKLIREQAEKLADQDRRIKAAESIIDQLCFQVRKLKESSPTPGQTTPGGREQRLEAELNACKGLLECALQAISKLKGVQRTSEAATKLVAGLLESIKASRRSAHVERLLRNEPMAESFRKELAKCGTIRAINESYTNLKRIQGASSPAIVREPLPGQIVPGLNESRTALLEGRNNSSSPVARSGDAVQNRLVASVGGV